MSELEKNIEFMKNVLGSSQYQKSKLINQKISFLKEMISCSYNLCFWTYDSDFQLLPLHSARADHEELQFSILFQTFDLPKIKEFEKNRDYSKPIFTTNSLGLMWICDFELNDNGELELIYVIGPAFLDNISPRYIEETLSARNFSIQLKKSLVTMLKSLPVINHARFKEYGKMLHFCITGDKMTVERFNYLTDNRSAPVFQNHTHGTWAAEQEMLKMVEEGNLNYEQSLHVLSNTGQVGTTSTNSLQNIKYLIIVHIALVCRAAIRGGLSPETGYSLADMYNLQIDQSSSYEEIAAIHSSMVADYVQRVHEVHLKEGYSAPIRECCDYIRMHYTDKLNISELAAKVGYTENYLSKKFKQETGQNVVEYITSVKIDAAKELLRSQKSISDVSDLLGFHSQSYFGVQFKKATGYTPKEYQKRGYTEE